MESIFVSKLIFFFHAFIIQLRMDKTPPVEGPCGPIVWKQSEKKAKMGALPHVASKIESLDHAEPFFLSSPRRSIQRVPHHDDSFQMVLASALPFHNHHSDSLITAFSKG